MGSASTVPTETEDISAKFMTLSQQLLLMMSADVYITDISDKITTATVGLSVRRMKEGLCHCWDLRYACSYVTRLHFRQHEKYMRYHS